MRGNDHHAKPDWSQFGTVFLAGSAGSFMLVADHPQVSFAGWGPMAESILKDHSLSRGLGSGSPLQKLYDLDAKVLLLGIGYERCTCLHLSESKLAGVPRYMQGRPCSWMESAYGRLSRKSCMMIRILAGSALITSVQECLSQRIGWAGSFRFRRYAILEKSGWRRIDEKEG